jgi:hypothetical protein
VKHIAPVSAVRPTKANAFQEIFCLFNQTLATFLSAAGGSVPKVETITEKCDLPEEDQSGVTF